MAVRVTAEDARRMGLDVPRRHKYAARAVFVDGMRFDSHKEWRRYEELKLLRQAGDIAFILRQVPLQISPCIVDGEGRVKSSGERYVVDFVIHWRDGRLTFEDVKGHRTQAYRRKKRRVEAMYGIEIEEV